MDKHPSYTRYQNGLAWGIDGGSFFSMVEHCWIQISMYDVVDCLLGNLDC